MTPKAFANTTPNTFIHIQEVTDLRETHQEQGNTAENRARPTRQRKQSVAVNQWCFVNQPHHALLLAEEEWRCLKRTLKVDTDLRKTQPTRAIVTIASGILVADSSQNPSSETSQITQQADHEA